MDIPLFFIDTINCSSNSLKLPPQASFHIAKVLRLKPNDPIDITDGKGLLGHCTILFLNQKECVLHLLSHESVEKKTARKTIALSLLNSPARFEWVLEKATELGVSAIIPFVSDRTIKKTLNLARAQNIITSALQQSKQVWMPQLNPPVSFEAALQNRSKTNLIAFCGDLPKSSIFEIDCLTDTQVFIGPEGDFTHAEMEQAIHHQFRPITLGNQRLRSETAALVACVALHR